MRTVVLGPGERLKPAQLTRKGVLPADVVSAARDIVATVRTEGDAALSRYARDLDGVELESLRLPDEALAHALEKAPIASMLPHTPQQAAETMHFFLNVPVQFHFAEISIRDFFNVSKPLLDLFVNPADSEPVKPSDRYIHRFTIFKTE